MYVYSPGAGQTDPRGQNFDVNRKVLSLYWFVASKSLVADQYLANKIPEFMIIKNLLQIDLHVLRFSETYLVFCITIF